MLWTFPSRRCWSGPQLVPDGSRLGHGSIPAAAVGAHVSLREPSVAETAARCSLATPSIFLKVPPR